MAELHSFQVMLTLRDLVGATQGRLLVGNPHTSFEQVSIDTRTLKPGDLFFAIHGPRHDGHDHLKEAAERGACGVVIQTVDERATFDPERIPDTVQVNDAVKALQDLARSVRRRVSPTVIGLTGTNGKTTTKEMLAAILRRSGNTLATRGNLNNHLGLPLTLLDLRPEHQYVILEMGASREGDIALLAAMARPQVGIITNIGKGHLEHLKTPQGVLKVKRALWDALPADGTAVINADDVLLLSIVDSLRCRKLFFGLKATADVRAENIQETASTVRFLLHIKKEQAPVALPVPGRFQVLNALAAAAAAHAAGISLKEIVGGLESFRPVAMRMQLLPHPQGALLINDAYNANPSSVRASVESFCQAYPDRPRWLVLGDMRELGVQARAEHEALRGAWLASQPLERLWLYGRDVRFVLSGVQTVPSSTVRVERFRKKRDLIEALRSSLTARPAILFKGSRVMKLEQVIKGLLDVNLPPLKKGDGGGFGRAEIPPSLPFSKGGII